MREGKVQYHVHWKPNHALCVLDAEGEACDDALSTARKLRPSASKPCGSPKANCVVSLQSDYETRICPPFVMLPHAGPPAFVHAGPLLSVPLTTIGFSVSGIVGSLTLELASAQADHDVQSGSRTTPDLIQSPKKCLHSLRRRAQSETDELEAFGPGDGEASFGLGIPTEPPDVCVVTVGDADPRPPLLRCGGFCCCFASSDIDWSLEDQ